MVKQEVTTATKVEVLKQAVKEAEEEPANNYYDSHDIDEDDDEGGLSPINLP